MVRNLAMTVQLDDIARTVIKKINDRAISHRRRGEGGLGHRADARRRERERHDRRVGVIMSITKAPGFDTLKLTDADRGRAGGTRSPPSRRESRRSLLFQQNDFIEHAIGNLTEAIRDGAIMVTIVLFLFLLNFRTTFITLMAMPLSFAITHARLQMVRHQRELHDPRRPRRRHRHGRR